MKQKFGHIIEEKKKTKSFFDGPGAEEIITDKTLNCSSWKPYDWHFPLKFQKPNWGFLLKQGGREAAKSTYPRGKCIYPPCFGGIVPQRGFHDLDAAKNR